MELTLFCHANEWGEWFMVFRDREGRLWTYDITEHPYLCPVVLQIDGL